MDGTIPSNLPFPSAIGGVPRTVPAVVRPVSIAESLAAKRSDSVEFSSAALSARPAPGAARVSRLVAATVDVPVNFEAARPAASPGALPMYRHPADRNIAATGVSLGRRVDVTG